jgi:hypothetical protein
MIGDADMTAHAQGWLVVGILGLGLTVAELIAPHDFWPLIIVGPGLFLSAVAQLTLWPYLRQRGHRRS